MNRAKILLTIALSVALWMSFQGRTLTVPFLVQLPQVTGDISPKVPEIQSGAAAVIPAVIPPWRAPTVQFRSSLAGPIRLLARPTSSALRAGMSGHVSILISLEAPQIESKRRLPLNLALVIDRSGSMAARNKLEYAKKAAKIVVGQMGPGDRFALVSFDSVSTVLLPSTPVTDPEAIYSVIDGLTPGGSTNLSQGMADGKAEVLRFAKKDQVNRVLVMTDGLANYGETDPRVLARQAQGCGEGQIAITTLGLGADYNEDLLLSLAEYSGGRYYFIENPDQMTSIYATEMKGLLKTVARNVRVSVQPLGGASMERVIGYRGPAESNKGPFLLGDLSSGQTRRMVVPLNVSALEPGIRKLMIISGTYEDAVKGRPASFLGEVAIQVSNDPQVVSRSANLDVQERVASMGAATRLEEAMIYLDRGQRAQAQSFLLDQVRALKDANGRYRSATLSQQLTQMEGAARALDKIPTQSEDYRNFVKWNKFQAYQLSR